MFRKGFISQQSRDGARRHFLWCATEYLRCQHIEKRRFVRRFILELSELLIAPVNQIIDIAHDDGNHERRLTRARYNERLERCLAPFLKCFALTSKVVEEIV